MNGLDRQVKLEADGIHDGSLRYFQSREYLLASDTMPARDPVRISLKLLAEALLFRVTNRGCGKTRYFC